MKILPFVLLLALIGCSRSAPPEALKQAEILKWVPMGSSMASARQTMEQHGYSCFAVTNDPTEYVGDETNKSPFGAKVTLNGVEQTITNVSSLICRQPHEEVRFSLANGVIDSVGSNSR